ncbi:MAG TPA: hypothetical protein VEL76_07065 [Gemmataceae bacterium]|nr:hypothetical protein [Gemmataceae bacterium]
MAETTSTQQPAATSKPSAKSNGITKIDGVKAALAKLGQKAKPLAIKEYLKKEFGLDISTDVASNYKKTLAKRAKKAKAKAPAKAAAPAPKPAAALAAPKAATGGIPLKDIQTLKELVGRVGADHLKTLIDLLGR